MTSDLMELQRDDDSWVWADTPTGVRPFVVANPPPPRSKVPLVVLETLLAVDLREHRETLAQALDRHHIDSKLIRGKGLLLIDRRSNQDLGIHTQPDVWTFVHLLDGVFDPVLREGL